MVPTGWEVSSFNMRRSLRSIGQDDDRREVSWPTFSICKVGDFGLQTCQTVTMLKRATTVEFTAISPILYIHCCAVVLVFVSSYLFFQSNPFLSWYMPLYRLDISLQVLISKFRILLQSPCF